MLKNYFDENKYQAIKDSDNLLFKALEIATTLFENDVDKGGLPYMLHLAYVYKHVSTYEEKVIALLHDTIEDKDVSSIDLLEIGFPKKIVDDVLVLTRVKPTSYEDYIATILNNASREALNVKAADLENNIDLTRIKKTTVKDYQRVEKRYIPTREKILNRLKEMD